MSWGELSCKHFAVDCPVKDVNMLTCNKQCNSYISKHSRQCPMCGNYVEDVMEEFCSLECLYEANKNFV